MNVSKTNIRGYHAYTDRVWDILLHDRTTFKPIRWATSDYIEMGSAYASDKPILREQITGENNALIQPRVYKPMDTQRQRSKDKAEVFTPTWVCRTQNDLIDDAWFRRENALGRGEDGTIKDYASIPFPEGRTWKDYVTDLRLEITCGEAPYLISRYDATTGSPIAIQERVGLLDRKLWCVLKNTEGNDDDWWRWTQRAFQSVYGYEWQGDNLLLARLNAMETFIDFYVLRFLREPEEEKLFRVAEILSWNLWQMDGLRGVVPGTYRDPEPSFFDTRTEEEKLAEALRQDPTCPSGIRCQVMDWERGLPVEYLSLLNG